MIYGLGERLEALRCEHGLSRVEVAGRVYSTENAIIKYEKNINQPSPDVLIRLAEIYRVSTDYIIGTHSRRDLVLFNPSDMDLKIVGQFISVCKVLSE